MQKMKSSTMMFEGRILSLTEDEVEIEDGSIVNRSVVHHNGGVAVVAVKDSKILLVSQYRYSVQAQTLEIPAGKLERNEDSKECGIRELEEEAGYCCKDMKLITAMFSTPGFCSEVIYIYEAYDLTKVENPRPMDDDEFITVEWMDLKEAYEKVLNGTIRDAKTIIGIQHAYMKHILEVK